MQTLQRKVRKFCQDRQWDHGTPSNYAKSICIEAAELLELFQWEEIDREQFVRNRGLQKKLSSELADILIYCLDLASILNLDASELVRAKLRAIALKYPIKKVKGNRSEYYRIKMLRRERAKKKAHLT